MAFGGFAPLPLRLGGNTEEGWTPAQHARLCADLVAIIRDAPLAVFTFAETAGVLAIEAYNGFNGVGLAYAPAANNVGGGVYDFTFARSYKDAFEVDYPLTFRGVEPFDNNATVGDVTWVIRNNVIRITAAAINRRHTVVLS